MYKNSIFRERQKQERKKGHGDIERVKKLFPFLSHTKRMLLSYYYKTSLNSTHWIELVAFYPKHASVKPCLWMNARFIET